MHAQSTPIVGGTPEQILYLVNQGVVQPLCNLLTVQDSKVMVVMMMIMMVMMMIIVIDNDDDSSSNDDT